MRDISRYPAKVQRGIQIINDSFNDMDSALDEMMKLPVAALRALGFAPIHASSGYLKWPSTQGPWIDIWSPLALQLSDEKVASMNPDWWEDDSSPGHQAFLQSVRKTNSEAQAELRKLLDEFYANRQSPANVQLIIRGDTWYRNFRLHCQGAKEAAKPENKAGFPKWLRTAQAEMNDFAEFLCTKVGNTP